MRSWMIPFGIVVSLSLTMTALWGWQHSPQLVEDWSKPELAVYAVRCAAVALAAGAQIVLLGCVVGKMYQKRRVDVAAGVVAAFVCIGAIISAVTLALAGR